VDTRSFYRFAQDKLHFFDKETENNLLSS